MDCSANFCSLRNKSQVIDYDYYQTGLERKKIPLLNNKEVDSFSDFQGFFGRMGLVLANIDGVFNYTVSDANVHPRSTIPFRYCLIGADLDSILYLQYRSYKSYGEVVFVEPAKRGLIDCRLSMKTVDSISNTNLLICLLPFIDYYSVANSVVIGGDFLLQIPLDCEGYLDVLFEVCKDYCAVFAIRPIALSPNDNSIFLYCKGRIENPPKVGRIGDIPKVGRIENNNSERQFVDSSWAFSILQQFRTEMTLKQFAGWLTSVCANTVHYLNTNPPEKLWDVNVACSIWNLTSPHIKNIKWTA